MSDELMISTKDTLGAYDAIETAKPGEPLFPIQGGDPFGPPTVLHWASLCRVAGMSEANEAKAHKLLRKASDAEQVAWTMQAYQRGEIAIEGKRAKYNEEAEQPETQDRAEREAMIKGVGTLNNALALIADFADVLAKYKVHDNEKVELDDIVSRIKKAAETIEPRRENERS